VLISEDTEAKTDVGMTKTKKVVELDKVSVINGYQNTAVGYAIRDYLNQVGVPALVSPSGGGFTRKLFSPYIFRVSPATFQYTYEPSKWLFKKGYKRAIFVGADFAAPRECFQGFKRGFEEAGGKIVQDLWPPLGCSDYGPYISALKTGEADVLVLTVWGADSIRIINQLADYGMKSRLPIFGVASFCDEGVTIPPMGANAEGLMSCYISCPSTPNPENQRFVSEYKKRFNTLPGHLAYLAYIAAQATYEAMDKVKGNVEDKEKFLDALRKVNFTTPMGAKGYFDEKQGMVYDLLLMQVKKVDGEYHNFEIDRLKGIRDPVNIFP
jgi:branched-chain amino acid transport system substrate-binding protein